MCRQQGLKLKFSSVGVAAVIKPEGRGFISYPGHGFSVLLWAQSISRANAHMVYMGKKPALYIRLYI